jgi:hypothetical protein
MPVTGTKLSQIAQSGAAPALTDFVVGVPLASVANPATNPDQLYTLSQVRTALGGLTPIVSKAIHVNVGTGSDTTGDGSLGSPFKTIQHAVNIATQTYCLEGIGFGMEIVIHVAAGTYPENVYLGSFVGQQSIEISGAGTGLTIVNGNLGIHAHAACFTCYGGNWIVDNMTLVNTGILINEIALIYCVGAGAKLSANTVEMGSAGSGSHFSCEFGGYLSVGSGIVVTGTAASYVLARHPGSIADITHSDVTFSVDPLYPFATLYCERYSYIHWGSTINSGTVSGTQYVCDQVSHIQVDTTLPGTGVTLISGDSFVSSLGTIVNTVGFTGDSGAGGSFGYVPAPAAGDAAAGKFLKADATWAAPSAGVGSPGGANLSVQYNSSGTFGGATAFSISSGQPSVAAGSAYLNGTSRALYGLVLGGNQSWYGGNSGNLSATGTFNACFGYTAGAAITGQNFVTYIGGGAGQSDTGTHDSNTAVGFAAMADATSPSQNTVVGALALLTATSPLSNTVVGHGAMENATGTPASNVAIGLNSMGTTTATPVNCVAVGSGTLNGGAALGNGNTAIGAVAGSTMTSGFNNTLVGSGAGGALTIESAITALGTSALGAGTPGFGSGGDVYVGYLCGFSVSSSGGGNLGVGSSALGSLAGGAGNVALGSSALAGMLGGSNNMGIGQNSLTSATSGSSNVAVGQNTLTQVTTQSSNLAIGQNAGQHITSADNTCIGTSAGVDLTLGQINCIISGQQGINLGITTGSGNTVIGNGLTGLTNPSGVLILASGATSGVGGSATIRADFGYGTANAWTMNASAGVITTNANFMLRNNVGLSNGAAGTTPTLGTNGPTQTTPTKWLPYDDNGVTRYIPAY